MLLTFAAGSKQQALQLHLQLLPVVFWQAKEQNAITRDLKKQQPHWPADAAA